MRKWVCNRVAHPGWLAVGLLVLGMLWLALFSRRPGRIHVHDPSLHFTFCTIARGTNHTFISGNWFLARLNSKLMTSFRMHPITHDRMYNFRSFKAATILGCGYRYSGDSLNPGRDVNLGYHLVAAIVQPGGRAIPLKTTISAPFALGPKEHVRMCLVPEDLTNLAGCELRLSRRGTNVASVRLQ